MHFLIHPGYLSDPHTFEIVGEEPDTRYDVLVSKYLEEAKRLQENEIMIAFTHTPKSEMKKDAQMDKLYF